VRKESLGCSRIFGTGFPARCGLLVVLYCLDLAILTAWVFLSDDW
jgi:hypothetical protein